MLVLQKGLILPVPMYGGSYFFIQPTYYRVRGYHAASQSGTKESTSTLTQGIMVK